MEWLLWVVLWLADWLTKYFLGSRGVSNPGIAFGVTLLDNYFWWVVGILILWWLVYLIKTKHKIEFSEKLIMVGGWGNLTDKLIDGKIIDWIPINIFSLWINLADIYISLGVCLWILKYFTKTRK